MRGIVVYNHGKDSIPWGEKPLALAEIAKQQGFDFISPDYTQSNDPDWRVSQLLALNLADYQQIILAGSSMGAYVATVASESIKPNALFLLAPAVYLPGYQRQDFAPTTRRIDVFHGWQDDVVPPENAWRFCQRHHARLQMFDADHRLLTVLDDISTAFTRLLAQLN